MNRSTRHVLTLVLATFTLTACLGGTFAPSGSASTASKRWTHATRAKTTVRQSTQPLARSTSSVPAATSSVPVGVSIIGTEMLFSTDAQQARYLDQIAATGARWVRFDLAAPQFTWDNASQYHWAGLDKAVAGAQKRNLKVLGILHILPVYARPAGAPANYGPATATERAAFAKYTSVLTRRYAGRIAAYEVWNEPNQKAFWAPTPNIGHYSALFTATSAAIRAADPKALVVTGGVGGIGVGSADVDAMTWIQGFYGRVNRSSFDAVGVHAYPNLFMNTNGELDTFGYYRRLVDAKGDKSKPLWLTETGAPTGGQLSTDQLGQVRFMKAAYTNWKQQHHAGPVFYYTLNDRVGTDRENYFGMVTSSGAKKLSFTALQQLAAGKLG